MVLSKSLEGQSAAVSQPLEIAGLTLGLFLQFVADNIDHIAQSLDGLNTFHGMGRYQLSFLVLNVHQE